MKKLAAKLSEFFYSLPRTLFISLYKKLVRIRIFNYWRLPQDRPAILAINHTTGADPIIILAAVKKKIYFLADSDNFRFRFTNFFMRKFAGSIPIFKEHFSKNIKSFRELFALNEGKAFFYGVFPEGKLNKEGKLAKMDKGAAYLSYKTNLPIIPLYIQNQARGPSKNSWLGKNRVAEGIFALLNNTFRKINIMVGDPIYPMADNIMESVKDLADKKTYKQIIDEIHGALEQEFFKLESESEDLFKSPEQGEEPVLKDGYS
ncbi:MAG: lysophospholipid acyltransferase family protein [Actinomycetota bacterium]|nr:lysophospholipid acyltransferase family protein [Actinomycetota bacterium]